MIQIAITPAHAVTYQTPTNSAVDGSGVVEPGESVMVPPDTVVIVADPDRDYFTTIDLMPRDFDYMLKVVVRNAHVHSFCIL